MLQKYFLKKIGKQKAKKGKNAKFSERFYP